MKRFAFCPMIKPSRPGRGAWLRCDSPERTAPRKEGPVSESETETRRESGLSEISTHRAPHRLRNAGRQPLSTGFISVFAVTTKRSMTAVRPRPPPSLTKYHRVGGTRVCLVRQIRQTGGILLCCSRTALPPSVLHRTSEPNHYLLSTTSKLSQRTSGRLVLSARPPNIRPITTFPPSSRCSPFVHLGSAHLAHHRGSQLERRHVAIYLLDRLFVLRQFDRVGWGYCGLDACVVQYL